MYMCVFIYMWIYIYVYMQASVYLIGLNLKKTQLCVLDVDTFYLRTRTLQKGSCEPQPATGLAA